MRHAQTSMSDVKIISGNNGTQSTDVETNDFLYVTYLVIERAAVNCFTRLQIKSRSRDAETRYFLERR